MRLLVLRMPNAGDAHREYQSARYHSVGRPKRPKAASHYDRVSQNRLLLL